jgi:hypothetical protein
MVGYPESLIKVDGTYYLYLWWAFGGLKYNSENYVAVYSSKDLANWKFENKVFTVAESYKAVQGNLVGQGSVKYNPHTRKYVRMFKYRLPFAFPGQDRTCCDGKMAWATSDSPTGMFQVVNIDPRGGMVNGMCNFNDLGDGKMYAGVDGHYNGQSYKSTTIYELDSDWTSIVGTRVNFGQQGDFEACVVDFYRGNNYMYGGDMRHMNGVWQSETAGWSASDTLDRNLYTSLKDMTVDPGGPDNFGPITAGRPFYLFENDWYIWFNKRYMINNQPVISHEISLAEATSASGPRCWVLQPGTWKGIEPVNHYYQTWYIDAAAGTWKTGK